MSTSDASDGRYLLAQGSTVPIMTPGGELADATLRFDGRSLARLELEFGSLDEFAATLRHQPFNTVAAVFQVTMSVSKEQALDMIDSRSVRAYVSAIGEAIEEALGPQDANQGNPEASGNGSRGDASSGSRSSVGTSTQSASGA